LPSRGPAPAPSCCRTPQSTARWVLPGRSSVAATETLFVRWLRPNLWLCSGMPIGGGWLHALGLTTRCGATSTLARILDDDLAKTALGSRRPWDQDGLGIKTALGSRRPWDAVSTPRPRSLSRAGALSWQAWCGSWRCKSSVGPGDGNDETNASRRREADREKASRPSPEATNGKRV
jgi:hypothetical protein